MDCIFCKEGQVVIQQTEDIELRTTEEGYKCNDKEELIDSRVTAVYCNVCNTDYGFDVEEEKVIPPE